MPGQKLRLVQKSAPGLVNELKNRKFDPYNLPSRKGLAALTVRDNPLQHS